MILKQIEENKDDTKHIMHESFLLSILEVIMFIYLCVCVFIYEGGCMLNHFFTYVFM